MTTPERLERRRRSGVAGSCQRARRILPGWSDRRPVVAGLRAYGSSAGSKRRRCTAPSLSRLDLVTVSRLGVAHRPAYTGGGGGGGDGTDQKRPPGGGAGRPA